jgi:hypothetical protein
MLKLSVHDKIFYVEGQRENLFAENLKLGLRLWYTLFDHPLEVREGTEDLLSKIDVQLFLELISRNARSWMTHQSKGTTFQYEPIGVPALDRELSEMGDIRLFLTRGLFLKKIQLPNQPELEDEAILSYLSVERDVRAKGLKLKRDKLFGGSADVLTTWERAVLSRGRSLLAASFSQRPTWVKPKHGGGSTAEGCGPIEAEKERFMSPLVVDYRELYEWTVEGYLNRQLMMLDPWKQSQAEGRKRLLADNPWLKDRDMEAEDPELFTRVLGYLRASEPSENLRMAAVPDSSTKVRVITMEPAWKMFAQQNTLAHIVASIQRSPILRRIANIVDQEPQRDMLRNHADRVTTTDLSRSSDRNIYDPVVKWYFQDTYFAADLELLRTPRVNIEDKQEKLWKFAGMGNALTFPVQTLLYSTLAWAINPSGLITVFGDDIITEDGDGEVNFTQLLHGLLEKVGLVINKDKTFPKGSKLKESCGLWIYDGQEVTPLYNSRQPKEYISNWSPREEMRFISLHNRAVRLGLTGLAREIRTILGDSSIEPTLTSEEAENDRLMVEVKEAFLALELRVSPVDKSGHGLQNVEYKTTTFANKALPGSSSEVPNLVNQVRVYRSYFTRPVKVTPAPLSPLFLLGVIQPESESPHYDLEFQDRTFSRGTAEGRLYRKQPGRQSLALDLTETYGEVGKRLSETIGQVLRDELREDALKWNAYFQEEKAPSEEEFDKQGFIPSKATIWRPIDDRCPVDVSLVIRYIENKPLDAAEQALFNLKGSWRQA